jgi:hypothetical protein
VMQRRGDDNHRAACLTGISPLPGSSVCDGASVQAAGTVLLDTPGSPGRKGHSCKGL